LSAGKRFVYASDFQYQFFRQALYLPCELKIEDLWMSLRSVFLNRQNSFLRHSLFDIFFFRVSFSIKLAVFLASGWTET